MMYLNTLTRRRGESTLINLADYLITDIMPEGNPLERVKSFDANVPDSTRKTIEELKSKALDEGKLPCRFLKYDGRWFAYCCPDDVVITDTDRDPNNREGSSIYKNHLDLGMLTICILDEKSCYKKMGIMDML